MGTDLSPTATRLGKRFVAATEWAATLHADQARKGKPDVSYVSHLLGVASLVLADGGSEEEAIAALLHDAVEDCDVPLREIRFRFGNEVGDIVASATDTIPGSTDRGEDDWLERKTRYLAHLEEVDVPALRVSAADKLYNARDIVGDLRLEGPSALDRFNAPPPLILGYYVALARVFTKQLGGALSRELAASTEQMVALAGIDPEAPGEERCDEHS